MWTKLFVVINLLIFSLIAKSQSDTARFYLDVSGTIGGGFMYDTSVYLLGATFNPRCYYDLIENFKIGASCGYGIFTSNKKSVMHSYFFGPSVRYRIKPLRIVTIGLDYTFSNTANDTAMNNYDKDWPVYQYLGVKLGFDIPLQGRFRFLAEYGYLFIVNRNRKIYDDIHGDFLIGLRYRL
jgi:hypothetical protein